LALRGLSSAAIACAFSSVPPASNPAGIGRAPVYHPNMSDTAAAPASAIDTDNTRKVLRALILELYAVHGLTAFRLQSVRDAIELIIDIDLASQLAATKTAAAERQAILAKRL
jgi:hypothetical protein